MNNIQYAVCHIQRGSGNDSGMSCHIERKDANGKKYVPENADASRTHLNKELIKFPDGVKNRTGAIQHRIDNAGLHRKVAGNQTKAIRIILTGTHERMMEIYRAGKLDIWIDANMKWLRDTFGEENLVSCVLHMDEKTPHLHATVVPIVTTERQRRKREGERKYETKAGARLSADDVMKRSKLYEYQDSYAAAMKPFGLQRGIVGSTAKHTVNSNYYTQQIRQYEEDIAKLQADVEKAKEGKSWIFSLIGKGDLAKAKKDLTTKDKEIAALKEQLEKLEKEKTVLQQKHAAEIAKLRNGYQKEIAAAIKRAETSEWKSLEHEKTIETQRKRITELDRKVNPQRYRLSSGAELQGLRFLGSNPYVVTLKIWTIVHDVVNTAVEYLSDDDSRLKAFSKGELTDHELVNAVFNATEQINEVQSRLLKAGIELAMGGAAQPHVGTGGGGSTQHETGWDGKKRERW